MEEINIAVIGSNGVGKSHFIQRAMSLPRVPGPHPTTARIQIDNMSFAVLLFELDLEYFDVDPERQIKWPKQIGGSIMPRVDGVLLLFDVTSSDSIAELPQTSSALVNSSLPTVLVATKCDSPEDERQMEIESVAAACPSCLATFGTSAHKPESARLALSTLIRALSAGRQDPDNTDLPGGQRRRAASAAHLDTPVEAVNNRPLSQHSRHSRASSDMSLLKGIPLPSGMEYRSLSKSPRVEYLASQSSNQSTESVDEVPVPSVSHMLRSPGVRLDSTRHVNSFLDVEDSDADSLRYSDDIPILQRNDEMVFNQPAKKTGVTFDELVDRLIAPKFSRADSNFMDVFHCLYRKFSTPNMLFSAILSRLDRAKDDKSVHYLTKVSNQLRIIEVVAKWVSAYPGDFARPRMRRSLEDFIRHLSTEPIFAAAAQQMRRTLSQSVLEDDETGWMPSNDGDEAYISPEASHNLSVVDGMGALAVDDGAERRPSASSSLYTDADAAGKNQHFQFHTPEDYEREAATMEPTYHVPLTKLRYHMLMETSDDDIADELTKIDWVMFSSIRIRDLVRHVSLSTEQKGKCKSARNVNRMIAHFNHIAQWVSNLILMRDKAKHRAQMLEKFMNIALKLRQLNNYNSLAAVIAGINGAAVHRLVQTRQLVSEAVQKRFARLVLLMGTQKSHFAYRLAWENSPLPRIPFMPLHRRDLVSAEEGGMTFVGPQGDRINWKKFEVLGEVLLPIMKSQGFPYPNLTKHDTARELILDCLMPTDEEEIYQRSMQVESSAGAALDSSKKKFPWFAK
ncbi:ras guanine nucleotide exchange factor domain-containing protein [Microdochium trichocladiopsis]|uniref:Ras guanine nucleotide exchange factor domain-containing protein n=1 Tax=Microdochium trichocladiopsis TaxID=1682393 RepID=A0A9P8YIV9_9PEZI|nr:ras guanine nucleotide exchange factor domain-containing protein [Microdochium trichocladiopsis]KAH7040743.1 ras guanine nucleotide exchange factor domain-containing protein [Microdochium trichocladiopsis]